MNTRDLWNRYARYFNAEETIVFPPDRPELNFYRELRKEYPGEGLEIGAGSGRLASALHTGSLTVALEPSELMLGGWPEGETKLSARLQGIGELMPLKSNAFTFVCFPYNGLQCVSGEETRTEIIREAFRVTAPGGVFVLEVSPVFARRGSEPLTQRYNALMPDGSRLILREKVEKRADTNSIRYHMFYTTLKEGSETSEKLTLDLAATSRDEMINLLSQAGFCDIIQWGNYDRTPYDDEMSPRLLLLAGNEK